MSNDMRWFEEPGVGASVLLPDAEECLPVNGNGIIAIPEGMEPKGFHLILLLPREGNRTFVTQKNVGTEKGGYHNLTLDAFEATDNLVGYLMTEPIEVKRAGKNVWTFWHSPDRPNRTDCFRLEQDGSFHLYQVGVITHDDGKTWRLHGEYRWRGKLFKAEHGLVAKPEDQKWGSFAGRDKVFDHPTFRNLAQDVQFEPWCGTKEDLDPLLGDIPGTGFARVQWYVSFGGQTGQGIAILHESSRWKPKRLSKGNDEGISAWIHGIDIQEPADSDGVKRLWFGDLISFSGTASFGKQEGRPPKLLNIKKVR
jgi:hypothetical protein